MKWGPTFESRSTASVHGRERERQMWRAARQRTKPARDWYRCHRERSEPCLKKRGHRFSCPLNKQRDISAPSLRCASRGSSASEITLTTPYRWMFRCDQTWLNHHFFFVCVYVTMYALCCPCSTETQLCLTSGERCDYFYFECLPFISICLVSFPW